MGSEYSSILFLNAQSISPDSRSSSNWKIKYISDNLLNCDGCNIPILGITETWLKSYHTDAQIHIANYIPFRSDRSLRRRGGTVLYIHESIAVTHESSFDDGTCEAILCTIPSISTVLINVYRPPDASLKSFTALLKHIQSYFDETSEEKYHDVNIMGDFNFPNIDWLSLSCAPTLGREQHESGEALLEFIQNNMLVQIVDRPTRKQNTLDLFLTNNDRVIRSIAVEETALSDHDLVKINLLYNIRSPTKPPPPCFEDNSFRSINLQKADYTRVNEILSDVDWDVLLELCDKDPDGNDYVELVRLTVLQACLLCSPKKPPLSSSDNPKSEHSRKRYILNRKRRKISAQLSALKSKNPTSNKIRSLEDAIDLIHFGIKETYKNDQLCQEKKLYRRS